MKYEVIKGVVIRGTQYKTGDTVDIDDLQLANDMMNLSRVIPYTPKKKSKPAQTRAK